MRQLKITKSITNRESQSLEKYFQEINKVDLITPEEEVSLAQRIKAGDQILFGKYAGTELKLEGDEFLMMREEDVLGILN